MKDKQLTKEEILELIAHANQTGRGLTSNLAQDIVEKMSKHIDVRMESKINDLKTIVTEQNNIVHEHFDKVDNYIVRDEEWKEKFTPMLETSLVLSKGGGLIIKAIFYIATFIAVVYGAITIFKK